MSTPLLLGGAAVVHVAACLALDRHVRLGADDEAAFWRSDLLAGWQRAYDGVFAAAAVVVQASLLRKMAPGLAPSSPWADRMAFEWVLQLMLLAALCQLAAVVAAPRLYRRHRLPWAVAMRLLRLGLNSVQVWAASAHNPRRLGWHNIAASIREGPMPARSLLLAWSGASLGMMHNVMAPLPLRGVASMNLLLLLLSVGVQSSSVASELLHSVVLPSYRRLCAPVVLLLGDLTGLYLTDAEAGVWCERHAQLVVAAVQLLGCTGSVAVMALIERAMKDVYLRGVTTAARRREAALAARPAGLDPRAATAGVGAMAGDDTEDRRDAVNGGGRAGGVRPATDRRLMPGVACWASVALVFAVGEWSQWGTKE